MRVPAQVSLNRRERLETSGSRIMPIEPHECRQNGLRCRGLAERATSPLKDVLEDLAKRWMARATELERAQALRDANDPTPKTRIVSRSADGALARRAAHKT